MSIVFLDIPSKYLPEESFWEKNRGWIILGIFILLVVAWIVIEMLVKRNRSKEKTVCTVSMVGEKDVLVLKGDLFVAPLLHKDGYDFAGWYYDSAFTKPYYNRPIKSDITLYPKWVKHS